MLSVWQLKSTPIFKASQCNKKSGNKKSGNKKLGNKKAGTICAGRAGVRPGLIRPSANKDAGFGRKKRAYVPARPRQCAPNFVLRHVRH
jgi:hypothetical protein